MGNVSMEARDINYRGGETKMSVEDALKSTSGEAAAIAALQETVGDLQTTKANKTDIATEFSDLTNYYAGDLVYYEEALYEFQVDHTAGAWETSEVIQKDLSDIVTTLKSGLTGLLKRKTFDISATDITNHLYNTGVSASQYICVGGCTPYNPNFNIQLSNIQTTTTGFIRYRLYDVSTNQIVSDNAAYVVELVFVDKSMLSELAI